MTLASLITFIPTNNNDTFSGTTVLQPRAVSSLVSIRDLISIFLIQRIGHNYMTTQLLGTYRSWSDPNTFHQRQQQSSTDDHYLLPSYSRASTLSFVRDNFMTLEVWLQVRHIRIRAPTPIKMYWFYRLTIQRIPEMLMPRSRSTTVFSSGDRFVFATNDRDISNSQNQSRRWRQSHAKLLAHLRRWMKHLVCGNNITHHRHNL